MQPQLLGGSKLVLILDQFEQWLHGNRIHDDAPLIVALRHCDGAVLQAVLMVRDDFFLGIHRFLTALDRPIRQGENMALVDLFDPQHARLVLREFARAYDRQPDDAFLDQAVAGLSDDKDRLVAVHLALFADMLRNKDWTPEVLAKIGGATGVGRAFLEENFDHSTASPAHRVHRAAAIRVLKALLPPRGADLKGTRQTRSALREISGYAQQERDYAELQAILVSQLRLVSPSATDADQDSTEVSFQLTHDYLVPALRDWLTAKDKETRRGRARLVLEERTEQWTRDPERHIRFLPTLVEFTAINLYVPRRQRTEEQRKMLHAATARFGKRVGIFAVLWLAFVTTLAWAWNDVQEKRARDGVETVLNAPPDAVPFAVENVRPLRSRVMQKFQDAQRDTEKLERQRVHAAVALAVLGEPPLDDLLDAVAQGVEGQCDNLVLALRPATSKPAALEQIAARYKAASAEGKARFAIVALHLGDVELAKEMTKLRSDPAARTTFIHTFARWHGGVNDLESVVGSRKTSDEQEADLRSALACALGLFSGADVLAVRNALESSLREWYRDAPDGHTHSAAYFALNCWKSRPEIPADPSHSDQHDWWVVPVASKGDVPSPECRLTMVKIPAGTFRMGRDKGFNNEMPLQVTLTRDFYLSDREVTVGMFKAFLARAPDDQKPTDWRAAVADVSPSDDHPVQQVSWIHAIQFCNWLSREQNRKPCYTRDESGNWNCDFAVGGFRLPTEAEWEYAYRARAQTDFAFGDDEALLGEYAVYDTNSRQGTRPAGEKLPNGFGLFDMPGNVWEWCHDGYKETLPGGEDPAVSSRGSYRVYRGGGWRGTLRFCLASFRNGLEPAGRSIDLGFRVAQVPSR